MYKNAEGYPDPTAGVALEHIEYEEYLKKGAANHLGMKLQEK